MELGLWLFKTDGDQRPFADIDSSSSDHQDG